MTPARALLLTAACVLALSGCSSPTDAISQTFVFEGAVTPDAEFFHPLGIESEGIIRIEVRTLRSEDPTRTSPAEVNPFLGFGIGRPVEDRCSTTSEITIREGSTLVYGLNETEHCFRVFDTGILPEGAVMLYSLEVTPSS